MAALVEDTAVVQTLCAISTCFAFKLGPRKAATGYRAEDFKDDQIWKGRLVVHAVNSLKKCDVKLIDEQGSVFAVCPLKEGAVEKTPDSSRYFVIRIENQGRKAFIGLGFQERAEAFDFNVALQDWDKYVQSGFAENQPLKTDPGKDMSLKAGEKIHVALNSSLKDSTKEKEKEKPKSQDQILAPPPSTNSRSRRRRNNK